VADLVVTSVPLGHAFGRIGCLMHGCCHGSLSQSFFGVCYPAQSMAWHDQIETGLIAERATRSLPVHPVQVYEALLNLVIYVVLLIAYRRPHRDGRIVAIYLMAYPVARFAMEFLRGDARLRPIEANAIPFLSSLSLAQWTSAGLFAIGLFFWMRTRRKPVAVPA
jgi:prolipoprotein diacylglyceryltransferase